jgi:hypothetical protein
MPAPSLQWSETNTSAPLITDGITSFVFASLDANSNTAGLITNRIARGLNSFEKWNRLKVVTPAANTILLFGVWFSATLPQDHAASTSTLALYYGVNAAYATPVSSISTVATSLCSSNTTIPGAFVTTPANTIGAYSGYVTQQIQLQSGVAGGDIVFPSPWMNYQYLYN